MRVLVTGASGYIGQAVVAAMRDAGHTPRALVHSTAAPSDVENYVGDLAVPSSLGPAFDGIDVVCHLAGLTHARESWSRPADFFTVNTAGTANLLAAMSEQGVSSLVFASTGSIYGSPESQPMSEDMPDAIPHPYAASKRAAELGVEWSARAGDLRASILRLFNVAGGRDPDRTRIVPRVLAAAAGDAPHVEINGDGSAKRDLLHIRDAAAAFIAAVEHLPPAGSARRFNIGSGVESSVLDVVATAGRVTGRHIAVVHRPASREPARLVADPARAATELGWKPTRSGLEEILADAWAAERTS